MHITNNLFNFDWLSIALIAYLVNPFIMIISCLLSVLVVLGNLLVVSAIWHENQLHSVTNYLIASLAAADCLVGAVVMPSSIISDIIIGSWTLGANWCDLWHSFDVLASTASIMNLCAISYDRYLAITDPISYPTRMTPKIVALIIVSLWTCSSLISFPAIIWWRAVGEGSSVRELPPPTTTRTISPNEEAAHISNTTASINDTQLLLPVYKCEFTNDTYYLLFSSFVSFYIPLCVMLYAYYRIYKAAVQQTRFLKHGSKQVMIGGRKKMKRSRHTSELSGHGDSERTGTSGMLYSDGLSTMESYDKQHLVLRAHRGGGGNTTSGCLSKTGGTEASSIRIPNEKKRRKDLLTEPEKLKLSPDMEHESRVMETAQLLNDLNQSNLSKNDSTPQAGKQYIPLDQDSLKEDRINFINSRRDKLKVECQRFDSKPIQSGNLKISHIDSDLSRSNSKVEAAHDHQIARQVVDIRQEDLPELEQIGRPLMVTMYGGSTNVDVSIIERSQSAMNINDREFKLSNLSSRANQRKEGPNQKFIRNQQSSITSNQNKLASNSKNIGNENDTSDGLDGNESSSSSASYGTGSIISVMIRPQQSQQPPLNSQSSVEGGNYNPSDSQPGSFILKRALSFREFKRRISTPKPQIEETINEPVLGENSQSSRRYRASCGDQSTSFEVVSNLKTSKALNIRSLLTRTHANKDETGFCSKTLMKPPSSLLPLMSMNSDTSTDSSITGPSNHDVDETLKTKGTNRKLCLEANQGNRIIYRKSMGVNEKTSTLNSGENRLADGNQLIDKNFGLGTDIERGEQKTLNNKAQMLYYDSDKLIQSLVDLTDIRYIDCTNIKDVTIEEEPVECLAESASINATKTNLDQTERIQIPESTRANMPRQHRSMGKKLSKLAKERKAAKTLGIVVGVFILCWLPFFVMNILVALCGTSCIYKPQVFGPVFTWLGWLNSAMNPVIYACWSRDFRRAFRRVLCSWVEFVCPYDGAYVARKLRLKKSLHKEQYLNRTVSSIKGNTSTATTRSGLSIDRRVCNEVNGSVSRSLLSDQ